MAEGTGLRRRGDVLRDFAGGATGAGIVLVMLPSIALYYGLDRMNDTPVVGLPVLAIFGIMILLGAMALVSTLFERLGLANSSEALALPKGSVRATIALSLIVLFAIISIMLFQTMAKPYIIPGLSESDKNAVLSNPANRVLAVEVAKCRANPQPPASAPEGPAGEAGASSTIAPDTAGTGADTGGSTAAGECYNIHIVQPPGQEAFDLAKQLLILIGTLMTSLTAYYFAAQSTVAAVQSIAEQNNPSSDAGEVAPKPDDPDGTSKPPASQATAPMGDAPADVNADEVRADGCEIVVTAPTEDKDLPPAKGGVAP